MHAIVDHFRRASEGALVCLAEACRARKTVSRIESAGHSMGSVLECAACFDIAMCKSLVSEKRCNEVKQQLGLVFRQLYALTRSWKEMEVKEDSSDYGMNPIFNHEKLKVYGLGLQVNRCIASLEFFRRLPRSGFRPIDEAATSIVLNIAEGNGRFSHLDHSRFLEIANSANTKLAARLEICAIRGTIEKDEADEIIGLLVKIDGMTAKLADAWRSHQ